MRLLRSSFAVASTLALLACGDSGGPGGGSGGGVHAVQQPEKLAVFDSDYTTLAFEIDYATGAEPYTGQIVGFGDVWGLFETNVNRLYQGRGKTITVPTTLGEMEELTDVSGDSFDQDAIFAIVKKHRDQQSDGSTVTYYVLFLDGEFDDGTTVRDDVLGVSFGGSGIIAMFKPVIASTGADTPGLGVEKYVEQAALVHEFGHAAGLVNDGVSMTTMHQDEANGAHCTNPDCIMYYQIEGKSGAVEFVKNKILSESTVLFGDECLADVDAVP
jgi:hypothetical protein